MADNALTSVFEPGLASVLDTHQQKIARAINCTLIGTVELFNPLTNTVSVSLNFKRQLPDGRVLDFPLLTDVPVFIYSGGYSHFVMPIEPGDTCIVLFCDKDIDLWHYSGETKVPNTPRTHALSDGIALVGIRPASNPHDITPGIVELTCGSPGNPRQFQLSAFAGAILGSGASGTHCRLMPDTATLEGVPVTGGKVQIGPLGLVSVKNTVASLFTVLDTVITQAIAGLGAATPANPSNMAAALAALAAAKVQLALVMEP
jgi:hypothetical protein